MGRHVNGDTENDHDPDRESPDEPENGSSDDQLVQLRATISSDTHVGVDFEEVPAGTPDAAPSPSRPDALVEHGAVGDGHELE